MIGIDEVGRGCWAGPLLVIAARELSKLPNGLKDSKKLSAKKRQSFYDDISIACDIGEGWVSPKEIDDLGLTKAMALGVSRSLIAIDAKFNEEIIMDGLINYCDPSYSKILCVAKADDMYPVVSAASIYAKVTRDKYMAGLSGKYKVYEFDKHVGYGTKLHLYMMMSYGICDQHRLSFAPVARIATM